MALIIEDGSIVANAQSYASAADVRAFAILRGVALSADDAVVEAQIISAMDYIESKEPKMKGSRVESTQSLSWPRANAPIQCNDYYPDDQIPPQLKQALGHLVIAQFNGAVLMPVLDPNAARVKRKKVDVLETEYFGPKETGVDFGQTPVFPVVDSLLSTLLRPGGYSAVAYRA